MDVRLASSLALLLAVCFGAFQGVLPAVCNNATLVPKLVDFENGATSARLECDPLSDYKWWRSNSSSCELSSFTPYLDVDCTTQICQVPLATLMDDFYMYFCCTRATVSSLEGIQPPKCFQIQVCPKIIDFVVPPVMFAGSQERVYVTIQANPVKVPNVNIYFQPPQDTTEIELFTVEGTVLNVTYVYIFEVPSDIILEEIEVSVSINSQCTSDSQSKIIQKIRNDSLPSPCPTSSALSLAVPSTSASGVVLFAPTPSPDVCPPCIKDCSADVLRPVVPLAVIIFLVATGIVGTVCVVYVILKCRKSSGCTEVTSSDEESSRSRPHTLTMIGNGIHGRYHEYATISNTSTPHTPTTHQRLQLSRQVSECTTSSTTTTPMGANNETHQLMLPPVPPRTDGAYSHEGDHMVLPNPESEPSRSHEIYSREGNLMVLPTSNSEPTAV